jgi:HAD superfamily hydrolase (TIGR01509 family)
LQIGLSSINNKIQAKSNNVQQEALILQQTQDEMQHVIKYAESNDAIHWNRTNQIAINLEHQNEYALSKLKAEGYLLAVASNSIKDSVHLMMEKSHLLPWLDVVLSNQDVEKPKPHPEIYTKAASVLGVLPKECLIVEDNHHGIAAAISSGAFVMEVKTVFDVTYPNIQKKLIELGVCP